MMTPHVAEVLSSSLSGLRQRSPRRLRPGPVCGRGRPSAPCCRPARSSSRDRRAVRRRLSLPSDSPLLPACRGAGRLVAERPDVPFHDLFEAREVLLDLLLRFLAEETRDERAELAARRVVLERDADVRRALAGRLEADAARRRHLRAF